MLNEYWAFVLVTAFPQQDTLATPLSKQMLGADHIPRPPSMFSPFRSAWKTILTYWSAQRRRQT